MEGLHVQKVVGIIKQLNGFIIVINKNILIEHRLLFLQPTIHLILKNSTRLRKFKTATAVPQLYSSKCKCFEDLHL